MIIDGKAHSNKIKLELKEKISLEGCTPTLVIITVGDNAASQVYVRNKIKSCNEVGINVINKKYDKSEADSVIVADIMKLNKDNNVHGVMVQLPLPEGHDTQYVIDSIDPVKDVDGLTTLNIGKLHSGQHCFTPCTPAGIVNLLDANHVSISGMHVLIIGRSNIVGKPIAELFTQRNATVTLCHSKTPKEDLLRLFAASDIVVSAVGKHNIISEDDAYEYMKDYRHDFYNSFKTKKYRTIVDVGINRDSNGKLCGDFTEEFKQRYSALYTPVPGGVGPMTVAMLLQNTYQAWLETQ